MGAVSDPVAPCTLVVGGASSQELGELRLLVVRRIFLRSPPPVIHITDVVLQIPAVIARSMVLSCHTQIVCCHTQKFGPTRDRVLLCQGRRHGEGERL